MRTPRQGGNTSHQALIGGSCLGVVAGGCVDLHEALPGRQRALCDFGRVRVCQRRLVKLAQKEGRLAQEPVRCGRYGLLAQRSQHGTRTGGCSSAHRYAS
jgi:hypothetical protein